MQKQFFLLRFFEIIHFCFTRYRIKVSRRPDKLRNRWTFEKALMATLFFLAVPVLTMFAQSNTVSGIVKDENGSPLFGVSVLVKGTTSGTSTNGEGRFSIKASPNSTLVFSNVGFDVKEVLLKDCG